MSSKSFSFSTKHMSEKLTIKFINLISQRYSCMYESYLVHSEILLIDTLYLYIHTCIYGIEYTFIYTTKEVNGDFSWRLEYIFSLKYLNL